MQSIDIVADRFGVTSDGGAVDLATGARVLLTIAAAGGASEQMRWLLRCDALHKMHHPLLAALIDYGSIGETQRFEAWQCSAAARAIPEHAAKTLSALNRSEERTVPAESCAIGTVDRRADRVVADLFTSLHGSSPHMLSVWGPPGSGRTTAALRAARVARLNGFVPVAVSMLARLDGNIFNTRHLCIISDDDGEAGWRALLRVALVSPRIHVLLRIGCDELADVHGVGLERIPADALIAAVRPQPVDDRILKQVKRAAAKSCGLPRRFAELLWNRRLAPDTKTYTSRLRIQSRVAEEPSVYTAEIRPPNVPNVATVSSIATPTAWLAGELTGLRGQSEAAIELLKKGRHHPGVRLLRQAAAGLSRRGDWSHAAGAWLALSSALLARGEARSAVTALADAKAAAERTGSDSALLDVAVLSAHAWIDLARLDEAESVVSAALTVARRIGDAPRALAASLALSRSLFWSGRYGEAATVLERSAGDDEEPRIRVSWAACAARAAVGQGDCANAMSLARRANDEARRSVDPALVARASCTAAFVHLAVGDLDAVAADVRAALGAAQAAHDPMRAIRARLLLAESHRRRGRGSASAAFLARIQRMDPAHLPPVVRARLELLQGLAESAGSDGDIAGRQAARSGLAALRLYVPDSKRENDPGRSATLSTDGLVGILRLCQTAEDETRVLTNVCTQLRKELHAAAVAVFAGETSAMVLLAGDGARPDPAIAARALTAGMTVAPHICNDRLESGAPVRYGADVIAALAARWPLGTPYDLSRAAAVLTMAAAAAAPVIAAAVEKRSRPAAPSVTELLGVAPAMSEVRRAIERAAPAPFAILIEGESGSGKELVAKAIHRAGLRRDRPFCTLNCAALPDDLIEAELFGHARGAFTGAINERAGVFEEAHGGTLFLDEVGELSPRAQAKLLRVIQEGELRRIGENVSRRVDVRIISATNRDLRTEAAAGRFRLDLLYRLDVIRLVVPPLRERREDIAILADHFWREATARVGSRAVLGAATAAALARYDWPGNVRELQNVLAALAVRTPRRGIVPPEALPPSFGSSLGGEACRLEDARRTFEERFVRAALVRTGGHRGRTATELGVTRQGLTKLMTRLGIADAR